MDTVGEVADLKATLSNQDLQNVWVSCSSTLWDKKCFLNNINLVFLPESLLNRPQRFGIRAEKTPYTISVPKRNFSLWPSSRGKRSGKQFLNWKLSNSAWPSTSWISAPWQLAIDAMSPLSNSCPQGLNKKLLRKLACWDKSATLDDLL